MTRCLLLGHRPVQMAASPDMSRCRAANVPTLAPGQPVVICSECGSELHVGTASEYFDLLDDRAEPEFIH